MIIADATPLIHLSRIGKLSLLQDLFTQVIIPEAVYREVVIKGREKAMANAEIIAMQSWIIQKQLSHQQQEEVKHLCQVAKIGNGEAEAIILAKTEKAIVLMDDTVGVRVAESFGLETYWTTSVILKAVAEGKMKKSEAKETIEDLVRTGYRLKPEILIELLKRLGE